MTLFAALVILVCLATCIAGQSSTSGPEKNRFIYDLTCKRDLKVLSTELFAGMVCFSNAFGVPFNETKGKFPPRMTKCMPPNLLKSKSLASPDAFKKWFCSQDPDGKSLDMMDECAGNMTEQEEQTMHECYIEIAGQTVREQVCQLKDQRELSWQFQEYTCMRQALASNETCLTETFAGEKLPSEKKQFAQWLCQDEHTPIALIHSQEACLFADSDDKDQLFLNCLYGSAKKLLAL